MATLPRSSPSKSGTTVSIPFSTSPRQLPEMLFNAPDCHDLTSTSGVSMKQYEEQLVALRKENFHLKLRIYFLEEKLGTGAPPSAQGLLEHNVRLQVEAAELRRQLLEKQELLAAAAQAIDVLEQQASVSTDSVDASIENSSNVLQKNLLLFENEQTTKTEEETNQTCEGNEVAVNYVSTTAASGTEIEDELPRLQRENRKALQMIKGCLKKIQLQEKEIKKLRIEAEKQTSAQDEPNLQKFEEIIKCKDDYIKDLETKVKEMQINIENGTCDNFGNVQELLTKRLQGLACFLDKLLSHKCVLGEEKKNLAQSILEQSIALSTDLKIDRSMAPGDFSIDESNFDMSQSMRLEDLTMMFGHHVTCGGRLKGVRSTPHADALSDSECWSEPDRKVSLARMGLCESHDVIHDVSKHRSRRSRVSYGSRSEDNRANCETLLSEQVNQLNKRVEQLEHEKEEVTAKLNTAYEQIKLLSDERSKLNEIINAERTNVTEANKSVTISHQALVTTQEKVKSIEKQLDNATQAADKLRAEKQELEANFAETEKALRRAADEATLQASQVAIERARAEHERMRVERELEEAREKLTASLEATSQLQLEITRRIGAEASPPRARLAAVVTPPRARPASPDQGIDSDRLSSLEQNELTLSPRSLYEENLTLRQKLARTKATLADALNQLNSANLRKRNMQKAICREIHKTHGVLRLARDKFEGNAEK